MNIFASSAGRLLTHCRIRIILNTGETPSGGFVCLGLSDFDLASAARALEFSVPRTAPAVFLAAEILISAPKKLMSKAEIVISALEIGVSVAEIIIPMTEITASSISIMRGGPDMIVCGAEITVSLLEMIVAGSSIIISTTEISISVTVIRICARQVRNLLIPGIRWPAGNKYLHDGNKYLRIGNDRRRFISNRVPG